jgi:hypothetical protein
MPKLTINHVAAPKLPAEIRRRRAALIDMLVEELDTLGHKVKHEGNKKQRAKRAPEDFLVERIVIDGVPVELQVCAMSDATSLRNKLRVRYSYVDPGRDKISYPATASEPRGGWDITKFAGRVVEQVERGKRDYAAAALEEIAAQMAEAIRKEYSDLDHRFYVSGSRYVGDDDFGPLTLNISGLCAHLVVDILDRVKRAHEQGTCGDAPERHSATPTSELN